MVGEIHLGRCISLCSVYIAIKGWIGDVIGSFPNVCQLYKHIVRIKDKPIFSKIYVPSRRYGTIVKFAALSRNVTSRLPDSIIDPRVGQLAASIRELVGAKENVSSPAERKIAS